MTATATAGPLPVRVFEHWAAARGDFLPDGRIVTAGMDRYLRLYSPDGEAAGEWLLSTEICCHAVGPDGTAYLGDRAGFLRSWSLDEGRELFRLRPAQHAVNAVAVSADGKLLLVTDWSGHVVALDARTGKAVMAMDTPHKDGGVQLAFSPDGKLAASTGGDWIARVWDVATGKEVNAFADHKHRNVGPVAFTPDGRQLAVGHQGAVLFWGLSSGKKERRLETESSALCFSPDGNYLLIGTTTHARAWEVNGEKELFEARAVEYGGATSIAFCPRSRRLLHGGNDGMVRLYDVSGVVPATAAKRIEAAAPAALAPPSGALRVVSFGDGYLSGLAWFPDGKSIVSVKDSKALVRWDVETGKPINTYQGPVEYAKVAVSPDGLWVAAASTRGPALFWKHDKTRTARRIETGQDCLRYLAFTPDGKGMVSGGDTEAPALWDLAAEKKVREFAGTRGNDFWTLALSADGTLLAGSGRQWTAIWDVASGEQLPSPHKRGKSDWGLAFSPDNTRIALIRSSSRDCDVDNTLLVWDLARQKAVWATESPQGHWVAWSPDGRWLAAPIGWGEVRIHAASDGQVVRELRGHRAGIHCLAFSPDSKLLATGGDDKTVRLWSIQE